MLNLKKMAVTGGLSCGKSSVCLFFKELGAHVVSADTVVHQLLSSNTNLGQEIIDLLGDDIVVNNKIDRAKVAKLVFKDPELLEELEDILHPRVYEEIDSAYERWQKQPEGPLFIAEVPLLYETQGEDRFDGVISVIAKREVSLKRFLESTDYEEADFENRMRQQMSLQDKALKADYVIMNDGDLDELKEIVTELFNELVGNE